MSKQAPGSLGAAAAERKAARKALREGAIAAGDRGVSQLRRGDSVVLAEKPSVRYFVEAVALWVGEPGPPDDEYRDLFPYPEQALIREVADRRIALSDPRRPLIDHHHDVFFRVMGQTLYLADVLEKDYNAHPGVLDTF